LHAPASEVPRQRRKRESKESLVFGVDEALDHLDVVEDHFEDLDGRRVPDSAPHDLRRWAVKEGELAEVGVLRHDDEVIRADELPDLVIGGGVETFGRDVNALGERITQVITSPRLIPRTTQMAIRERLRSTHPGYPVDLGRRCLAWRAR
jgi:hypothetical protein